MSGMNEVASLRIESEIALNEEQVREAVALYIKQHYDLEVDANKINLEMEYQVETGRSEFSEAQYSLSPDELRTLLNRGARLEMDIGLVLSRVAHDAHPGLAALVSSTILVNEDGGVFAYIFDDTVAAKIVAILNQASNGSRPYHVLDFDPSSNWHDFQASLATDCVGEIKQDGQLIGYVLLGTAHTNALIGLKIS